MVAASIAPWDRRYLRSDYIDSFLHCLLCTVAPTILLASAGSPLLLVFITALVLAAINLLSWEDGIDTPAHEFFCKGLPVLRWVAQQQLMGYGPKIRQVLTPGNETWSDFLADPYFSIHLPPTLSSWQDEGAREAFVEHELSLLIVRYRNIRAMVDCGRRTMFAVLVITILLMTRN